MTNIQLSDAQEMVGDITSTKRLPFCYHFSPGRQGLQVLVGKCGHPEKIQKEQDINPKRRKIIGKENKNGINSVIIKEYTHEFIYMLNVWVWKGEEVFFSFSQKILLKTLM